MSKEKKKSQLRSELTIFKLKTVLLFIQKEVFLMWLND